MDISARELTAFVPCMPMWSRSSKQIASVTHLRRRQATPCLVQCCLKRDDGEVAEMLHDIHTIAGNARGIFGHDDEDRDTIEQSIKKVESTNSEENITADNARVAHGKWRLLYTTLEILGNRRIRLGLSTPRKPGVVTLGEIFQTVNADTGQTSNIVHFNVLGGIEGTFSIVADYQIETENRVRVSSKTARLEPQELSKLLGKNLSLLTKIFNPEGTLDITYVDESVRIGRDGKGNVFVVERIKG